MRKMIVFRPGALGDTILTFPALAALRQAFPGAQIVTIGNAPALSLARDAGLADSVFSFDLPCWAALFAEEGIDSLEARRALEGADLAVLWLRDPEGLAARNLRALGIPLVLTAPGRPAAGQRVHVADYLLTTLAPAFGTRQPAILPTCPLALAPEARRWAADEWRARHLTGQRVLALHPGSGGRRKCWPPERYAALAGRFLAEGWRVLLIEGPADEMVVAEVQLALRAGAVSLLSVPLKADAGTGEGRSAVLPGGKSGATHAQVVSAILRRRVQAVAELPLSHLAAGLARATLFVGNDSGVSHLSAAVGAPTLALFGPTDPALWVPRGPRAEMLWAGQVVDGQVRFAEMEALSVEEVYAAALRLAR